MPRVIAISGYARSGKDTVADYLCSGPGLEVFIKLKFAAPLYDMLCAMYKDVIPHINHKFIEDHKDAKPPYSELTWRELLQQLGTEWGRDRVSRRIWTNIAIHKCRVAMQGGLNVAISDCRFYNEWALLQEAFGSEAQLWCVIRPSTEENTMSHRSELEINTLRSSDDAVVLHNALSLIDLHARVDDLLKK